MACTNAPSDPFIEIVAKLTDTHKVAELLVTLYDDATIEHVHHDFMITSRTRKTVTAAR